MKSRSFFIASATLLLSMSNSHGQSLLSLMNSRIDVRAMENVVYNIQSDFSRQAREAVIKQNAGTTSVEQNSNDLKEVAKKISRTNPQHNFKLQLYSGKSELKNDKGEEMSCQVVIAVDENSKKVRYFSTASNSIPEIPFESIIKTAVGKDFEDGIERAKKHDSSNYILLKENALAQSTEAEQYINKENAEKNKSLPIGKFYYKNEVDKSFFSKKHTSIVKTGFSIMGMDFIFSSIEAKFDDKNYLSSIAYEKLGHKVNCNDLKFIEAFLQDQEPASVKVIAKTELKELSDDKKSELTAVPMPVRNINAEPVVATNLEAINDSSKNSTKEETTHLLYERNDAPSTTSK